MNYQAAIETIVQQVLKQRMDSFEKTPTSTNWIALKESMYAYQLVRQLSKPGWDIWIKQLTEVGIGHWVKALADSAKGKEGGNNG